jgi:CubicO group peptidase (beta-lactamase class C family)
MDMGRIALIGGVAAVSALSGTLVVATAAALTGAAWAASQDIDAALAQAMPPLVEDGVVAGVITMVAVDDEVVATDVQGFKDVATQEPLTEDAIFQIASMTKPVTGVALMMLYEEGKFSLDDPVEEFLPGFANRDVMLEDGTRVPADHAPTMRELMSHSAGLTYGGDSPAEALYSAANLADRDQSMDDLVAKLADLPLVYQPGTEWVYSIGVDLQGALVETLSGQRFPDFLKDRIFDPLQMDDTAFFVPEEKLDRAALIHARGEDGLAPQQNARANIPTAQPNFSSGGGGLYSTAEDYLTFSRMLLNGGELNGVRILKPETVTLMASNQLNGVVNGDGTQAPGTGFGLDFAVVHDPSARSDRRGAGTFYWAGVWGTNFWVDPANDLTAVVLTQFAGGPIPDPANPNPDANNYAIRAIYTALAEE